MHGITGCIALCTGGHSIALCIRFITSTPRHSVSQPNTPRQSKLWFWELELLRAQLFGALSREIFTSLLCTFGSLFVSFRLLMRTLDMSSRGRCTTSSLSGLELSIMMSTMRGSSVIMLRLSDGGITALTLRPDQRLRRGDARESLLRRLRMLRRSCKLLFRPKQLGCNCSRQCNR